MLAGFVFLDTIITGSTGCNVCSPSAAGGGHCPDWQLGTAAHYQTGDWGQHISCQIKKGKAYKTILIKY